MYPRPVVGGYRRGGPFFFRGAWNTGVAMDSKCAMRSYMARTPSHARSRINFEREGAGPPFMRCKRLLMSSMIPRSSSSTTTWMRRMGATG